MALTTACSDSPSKLKVDSPLLPSTGAGAAAARVLMTWPLPRLITARLSGGGPPLPLPTASGSATAPSGARRIATASGLRCTTGPMGVTQPASSTVSASANVSRSREREFIAGLCSWSSIFVGGGRLGGLRFRAHLRAPRLDALADGFHLLLLAHLFRLRPVGRGGGGRGILRHRRRRRRTRWRILRP